MHADVVQAPRDEIDAVLFDMDGVVTDTASVHAAAWREVFDDALRVHADETGTPFVPFTEEDYLATVDGKPREDGIRSFLASRGIDPPDAPGSPLSVEAIGDRKNERFLELVRTQGARVFASTLAFVEELRTAGIRVGLFTASRNMDAVLDAAGVSARFDVRVGGVEAAQLGLRGKPEPDLLLEAAARLGVAPDRTGVVEDSRAGVDAASAAGFGWVLGVDREGNEAALRAAGAHAVVPDLASVRLAEAPSVVQLPSALASWEAVAARVDDRRPAVFLDYDGTLTPIVARPEDAILAAPARDAVARLASVHPVAVVSGRDLDDVRTMVGVEGIAVAGSHGFDIVGPDGARHQVGDAYLSDLEDAERALAPLIAPIEGARIERKRFAIAVHFREAGPRAGPLVRAAVDEVVRTCPRLRSTGGKMIAELRPDIPWDKGRAVKRMRELLGLDGARIVPIYVGDDETDEDAFREVRADGIGVIVRGEGDDRPTLARFSLADPAEVRLLLERLARTGAGRST